MDLGIRHGSYPIGWILPMVQIKNSLDLSALSLLPRLTDDLSSGQEVKDEVVRQDTYQLK